MFSGFGGLPTDLKGTSHAEGRAASAFESKFGEDGVGYF